MASVVKITVTDEFGKPARLDDIRWEFKLNNFVSALKKRSPVGTHEHDQVSEPFRAATTKDGRYLPRIPGEAGSLARHWKLGTGSVSTWKYKGKAQGIRIKSKLPHANIIDLGGSVRSKFGSWMHWRQGNRDIRTRLRKGYKIKGSNYVEQAANDFFDVVANCKVEWA